MLGSAIRFSFRSAGLGRVRGLLQRQYLPGVRTVLRRCISGWWSLCWRSLLRAWLSGCGDSRSWRQALLYSRRGLQRRPYLLRMEARPLGSTSRPKSLDPRPLRRARRILIGATRERRLSSRHGRSGDRPSLNSLNDRRNEAPSRQPEPKSCCQTAQPVPHASSEIDR